MRFSSVLRAAGVASVIAAQAFVAAPSWAQAPVPTPSSLAIAGAQISAVDPTELDVDLTVTCPVGEQHPVFVTARQDGSAVPVWGWAVADVTCTGAPQTVTATLTAEPTAPVAATWQAGLVDVFAVLACSPAAEAHAQITLV